MGGHDVRRPAARGRAASGGEGVEDGDDSHDGARSKEKRTPSQIVKAHHPSSQRAFSEANMESYRPTSISD